MKNVVRTVLSLGSLIVFVVFTETASAGAPVTLATEVVASGFDRPLFVAGPPNDATRLVVLEQNTGHIVLIKNGVVQSTPFLRLANRIGTDANERGLLGLAFHPSYQQKRFIYVNYTAKNGDTVIERYKVRKDFDRARKKKRKLIMRFSQPFDNHNGGMLAFGPNDGYLYIGTGDGGDANDPFDNAQNLQSLLGKMLRIDVNSGKSTPYKIPQDNPYVAKGGGLPEIWSYGLRNPWRYSFDRTNGDMYIGDVGQGAREEISFQPGNSTGEENYGWDMAEGLPCTGGDGTCGTDPGLTPPIHDYIRSTGRCITGGYVYRGTAIPGLAGTYFFADYSTRRIWSFRYNGSAMSEFTERTSELDPPGGATFGNIPTFGEDANGNLYIADFNGVVYRIVADS